ncbi:hypothetical protein H7X65_02985 [Candidatus Parcubacteria bacterium]|nr:hypothetical protein [Candidatus Parcubacteria bacterium]
MAKSYIQCSGKAVENDPRFKHVMAITLDPQSEYCEGVIRCIMSREGEVDQGGYIDRSELYKIKGETLHTFKIGEKLSIKNEEEMVKQIAGDDYDFLGLEDPDIHIDATSNRVYLYFTMPFLGKNGQDSKIYIGQAIGKDLDSLEMVKPVLLNGKEISVVPANADGIRLNLFEAGKKENDLHYSVVQVAKTINMADSWEPGDIIFHPAEQGIKWIAGHASPGPFFNKSFIDVGEGKMLGVINGRESNKKGKYGMFSIGLFIYDYEKGKIDWVSPEPFIKDTDARTITFASQFVETEKEAGILYAHVDDSFVRAYLLSASNVRKKLPKNLHHPVRLAKK